MKAIITHQPYWIRKQGGGYHAQSNHTHYLAWKKLIDLVEHIEWNIAAGNNLCIVLVHSKNDVDRISINTWFPDERLVESAVEKVSQLFPEYKVIAEDFSNTLVDHEE